MAALPSRRAERIAALRAEVQAIESLGHAASGRALPFGVEEIDVRLAGGGLAPALHEVTGNAPALSDDAAASLFVAGIAARWTMVEAKRTVIWALVRRDLFAPGLALAGLTPDRLIQAECRNDDEVLAVMEEGLRHGGLAAVVGEVGRAAMASTRRLQLAAEEGATPALMLKRWRRSGEDPLALPSAAATRWRIGCVPSGDLPVKGVGRSRWRIELVRQRGGQPCQWIMEGTDAEGCLAPPAGPAYRSLEADRAGTARRAA